MRLFLVLGQSEMLLLRAIFCHPWDSVIMFYADEKNLEKFREKSVKCAGALKKSVPHFESAKIPQLNQTNSIIQFAEKFNLDSISKRIEVSKNDMLFYSGTVLHLRCLITLLNFETILSYDHDRGFFAVGNSDEELGNLELTIKTFLEINNVSILNKKRRDITDTISIASVSGEWETKSPYMDKIEYSNDVLNIFWNMVPTSRQRKKIVSDCHLLKLKFGHYTVAHRNLPPEVERLIRQGYIPRLEEEEE
tara:strand:+ start:1120 stop:1869 length:750 start_codon:yes stop_codon:yes gene_type:complete